jgi:hypothetical protein
MRLIALLLLFFLSCVPAIAQGWIYNPPPPANPDAPYILYLDEPTLTNPRILAATSPLVLTIGGASHGPATLTLTTVPITLGGTGQITGQLGFNALANSTSGAAVASQDILVRGVTDWSRLAVGANGSFIGVVGGVLTYTTPPAGAPADAQYLTLALTGGLSAERVLTAGDGISLPDTGPNGTVTVQVDATVVRTAGAQSIAGTKTFTDSPHIANGDTLVFDGAVFNLTVDGFDVTANRLYTIPDVLADADFLMTQGAQTKAGILTLSSAPVLSTNTLTGGANTMTFPSTAQTLVGLSSIDVLTNKTLTAPSFTASSFTLLQSTANYTITWVDPAAPRTIIITDVGGAADMTLKTGAYTDGGIAFGDGNLLRFTATGSVGQPLLSQGTGDPVFGTLGAGAGGTGQITYAVGDILRATAATTLTQLPLGTALQVLRVNAGATDIEWGAGVGTGTVTSVAIVGPSIISYTGSPITTSGTFTGTLVNQNANEVLSGPVSGAAAVPTFRRPVLADLPNTSNFICGGRLTLSATNPTDSNTTAATTLFYLPYISNVISLYDGVGKWVNLTFTNPSIAIPSTSGVLYDIYAFNSGGIVTLEATAWDTRTATNNPAAGSSVVINMTNTAIFHSANNGDIVSISDGSNSEYARVTVVVANTSITVDSLSFSYTTPTIAPLDCASSITERVTDLTKQDGIDVKSGDTTRRFLGTIMTDVRNIFFVFAPGRCSVAPEGFVHVWNRYNRIRMCTASQVSSTSWTYTGTAWREAQGFHFREGLTLNTVVMGIRETPAETILTGGGEHSVITAVIGIGIGDGFPSPVISDGVNRRRSGSSCIHEIPVAGEALNMVAHASFFGRVATSTPPATGGVTFVQHLEDTLTATATFYGQGSGVANPPGGYFDSMTTTTEF